MNGELPKTDQLEEKVFSLSNEEGLAPIALEVYHFQYHNNPIYGRYCQLVGRTPQTVHTADDIPYLPISFFKTHRLQTTAFDPEVVFQSSGTTGMTVSCHEVKKAAVYQRSFSECFERFYGIPSRWCILGLLPNYLERGGSSLVYMVDHLVRKSGHPQSGFYLYEGEKLHRTLLDLERARQPTLLIGVTYALLDFAGQYPLELTHTVVMETGGMKGRKKELTRQALYDMLRQSFGVAEIHSEYGMTELLSQGYARNGRFRTPPWMKVSLRDETDPLSLLNVKGRAGAINVMDLANLYSCAFIATEDLGRLHEDGGFEVLGRMDNSDIRGCSLMAL